MEKKGGVIMNNSFVVSFERLNDGCFVIAELVNKNQLILVLNHNQIPLSQNDVEVLTSFFLDATDEYMEYDHIDFEFQTKTAEVNVCFMRT